MPQNLDTRQQHGLSQFSHLDHLHALCSALEVLVGDHAQSRAAGAVKLGIILHVWFPKPSSPKPSSTIVTPLRTIPKSFRLVKSPNI